MKEKDKKYWKEKLRAAMNEYDTAEAVKDLAQIIAGILDDIPATED